jgi:AcrR family transcriptional regulator
MRSKSVDKRSRLIRAAVELTYLHGFSKTSLADISKQAKVPLGNVYYYFKTKKQVGEAIIEQRLLDLEARIKEWDEAGTPRDRLRTCLLGVLESKEVLAAHGCPVGPFSSELRKEGGGLGKRANEIFLRHLEWMEAQFKALGKRNDSRGLAVHLLSSLEGVFVLAHTFRDSNLVVMEIKRLNEWIQEL